MQQQSELRRQAEAHRIVRGNLWNVKAKVKPVVPPEWKAKSTRFDSHVSEWRRMLFEAKRNTGKAYVRRRCVELDVDINDIMGNSRYMVHVNPRHQIMWEMVTLLEWSYPRVGRLFGRDHTTVLSAVRKIRRLMAGKSNS